MLILGGYLVFQKPDPRFSHLQQSWAGSVPEFDGCLQGRVGDGGRAVRAASVDRSGGPIRALLTDPTNATR